MQILYCRSYVECRGLDLEARISGIATGSGQQRTYDYVCRCMYVFFFSPTSTVIQGFGAMMLRGSTALSGGSHVVRNIVRALQMMASLPSNRSQRSGGKLGML